MSPWKSFVTAFSAFVFLTGVGFAGESMPSAKSGPNPGFERLKPLVGKWQGTSSEGKPVAISYSLVSDGSALVERLGAGSEPEMVTVYHPDGDRLMMTHYCSLHNQPRLRTDAVSAGNKRLAFDFVDATNLSSPDAMHMHRLVVTFEDEDHFTQEWTWKSGEKEGTVVFRLERMK